MSEIHAILLAAGQGKRLSPLTDATNKVLVEVGGTSIIVRMVQTLKEAGLASLTIVTGHCGDAVQHHLGGQFPDFPIRYVDNPDYANSNNIVSLAAGLEALPRGSALLLLEGDLVLDPQLIHRMISDDRDNLVLVDRYRRGLNGTLARLNGVTVAELYVGERLKAVSNPLAMFKTVNVTKLGAETLDQHFRPALEARLGQGKRDEYYEAALADMIATGAPAVGAVIVEGERWVEVDDHHDLDQARFAFAQPGGRRRVLDRAYGGYWNYPILDFAYPRNFHFPTAAIRDELETALPDVIGRYGSAQHVLDEKLSRFVKVPAEQLVLLNGLSQIFPWLAQQYGQEKALLPAPCFNEFSRVWPVASSYRDDGTVNIEGLRAASVDRSVIVFVNPNNPTGTTIPSLQILDFAREHPAKTVIVDESFADFSERPCLLSSCEGPLPANILLLKSLGKSLGVAGLRLGYAQSTDLACIERIRAALPVWNSNALAEAFLEMLPKYRSDLAASFTQTQKDRAAMFAQLKSLSCVAEVLPSDANFLLVRLATDVAQLPPLLDRLVDQHGIYVKDVSRRMSRPGAWLRLSARTESDNALLYAALIGESHLPAATSAAPLA